MVVLAMPPTLLWGDEPFSVAVGEFNGDGISDLAQRILHWTTYQYY